MLLDLDIISKKVGIYFSEKKLYDHMKFLYRHLLSDGAPVPRYDFYYNMSYPIISDLVDADNDTMFPCEEFNQIANFIERTLLLDTIKTIDTHIVLHSSILSKGGHTLLIPGRSGAGKSTMTMEMINRGFKYLSEEMAAVNLSSCKVSGMPLAIRLKKSSPFSKLKNYKLGSVESCECFSVLENRKEIITYVVPNDKHVLKGEVSSHGSSIIFIKFEEGGETALKPLKAVDALKRLLELTFNLDAIWPTALHTASKLVSNCDCYELRVGDPEKSFSLISRNILRQ